MKYTEFKLFDEKESGPHILALMIMERTYSCNFCGLIDTILETCITPRSEYDKFKLLPYSVQFELYRNFINHNLKELYITYLPLYKDLYKESFLLEINPYIIWFYSSFLVETCRNNLFNMLDKLEIDNKNITDEILQDFINEHKIDLSPLAQIPVTIIPNKLIDKISLIIYLYNVPPLHQFHRFFHLYHCFTENNLKKMYFIYANDDSLELPSFKTSGAIHYSYHVIPPSLSNTISLDEIKSTVIFDKYHSSLKNIEDKIIKHENLLSKTSGICPCCGLVQENIKIPKDVLTYRFLLDERELAIEYSFYKYDLIKTTYLKEFSEKIKDFFKTINYIAKPECLILVEGDSEEVSIPIISLRLNKPLKDNLIRVHNCGSKQKLYNYFLDSRKKDPNLPMIILLDSDARKEADDINRIIQTNKDRYRLMMIQSGTFEDLFITEYSIKIINEMYPEGEKIVIEDWDNEKDFLSNVDKILWCKKKSKFNKVEFSQLISTQIALDEIPSIIIEIIDSAVILKQNKGPIKF